MINHIYKKNRFICRHVGISPEAVKCFSDQLDPLLQCSVNNNLGERYGTGEEQHNDVIQKYDELCKLLRNLKELPLSINSIQGSAPVFRYSEVGYTEQSTIVKR